MASSRAKASTSGVRSVGLSLLSVPAMIVNLVIQYECFIILKYLTCFLYMY